MIVCELWHGQGLGNQLAVYITTRSIAKKLGYEFGIQHPDRFRGSSFLKNLNFGESVRGGHTDIEGKPPSKLPDGIEYYYAEKQKWLSNGSCVTPYDWDLLKIQDNTKIDGLMQGEDYFKEYKTEIRDWLKVDLIDFPANQCIINFRGGEYAGVKDFFLPQSYWDNAIAHMRSVRSNMQFRVVTDDVCTARDFFPDFEITHEMSSDYKSIQSAPYLILSNSSFAFFPAWLNTKLEFCIAPKYWARFNISDGYWSLDQNYTKGWFYLDRQGKLGIDK
jgi:hypothetical protein